MSQAVNLMREAEKKASGSTSRVASFFGGGPKYDEAGELYEKAGNSFKMSKQHAEASSAFSRAATMFEHAGETHEQNICLKEAGDTILKLDISKAEEFYRAAAENYNTNGKFDQSGRLYESLATTAIDSGNKIAAMEYFHKAADYYDMGEFSKSKYTTCIMKYAELSSMADEKHVDEAIQIFEEQGKKALSNNLLQYGAPKLFMKAVILCLTKGDAITAEVAIEKYGNVDTRFLDSKEGKLCTKVAHCIENDDIAGYEEALGEYDSIARFEAWHEHFWKKISKFMTAKPSLDSNTKFTPAAQEEEDSDLC